MTRIILICWVVFILIGAGCSEPPATNTTPEGAFARLAPCVDTAGASCLLHELDKDSRGAWYNISAMLLEMRTLVQSAYPADPAVRESAFGPWGKVAQGNTAEEMFALFCSQRDCLGELTAGFGVIRESKVIDPATVTVYTMRGAAFTMHSVNGQWGLATWRGEFMSENDRVRRNLMEVRRNAADYREQREATGTR